MISCPVLRGVGALLACAVGGLGCGGEPPAARSDAPVVRLIERLADAEVVSPLDAVEPVSTIDDLPGEIDRRVVAAKDFEGGEAERATPGCGLAARGGPHAGRALVCRGGGALELAVEPSRLYHLEASLRMTGRDCVFSNVTLLEQADLSPLLIHNLATVEPAAWTSAERVLFTTPETTRLYVRFRNPDCVSWLDDLHLEELRLDAVQELALIQGWMQRETGGGPKGARRGRLVPVPDPATAVPPRDDNYTIRDAIFAPAPSTYVFEVDVPEAATLHVAIALARESRLADAAEFRVTLHGAPERELLRETLVVDDLDEWRWRHHSLDLSPWAGQRVRLELATRSPGGRGYALWGAPLVARARRPDDPPNVVVVAVDTLRADRLSGYGYAKPTSPNLDALARDGIRFDRAISSSNWTGPAFHTLFSGLGALQVSARVPPEHVLLAERLREQGWLTHAIAYKPSLYDKGFDQGFDGFFNISRFLVRGDQNLAQAFAWLDRHHRERFFLFLHLNDPHQPFTQPEDHPPAELRARLEALGGELPLQVTSNAVPRCRGCNRDGRVVDEARALASDLYDDEIRYVDAQIGRLLDVLKELGHYDDALIVFVADHGESLWQHDELFSHAGPGLYDELIHVPLVVKPPHLEPARRGRVVASQVRLADVAPTVLELAGAAAAPDDFDGTSLVPLFDGEPAPDRPALSRGEGSVSLRLGGLKYARRVSGEGVVREELFDLRSDPGEEHSLAAERPEVVARLRHEIDAEVLRRAPFQSLLLLGSSAGGRVSVRVRAGSDLHLVDELADPALRRVETPLAGTTLVWEGVLDGRPRLLAPFRVEGPEARVHVALRRDDGEWESRLLRAAEAEPLAEGGLGDVDASGPPRVVLVGAVARAAESEPETLDARNLEALRALGYIE